MNVLSNKILHWVLSYSFFSAVLTSMLRRLIFHMSMCETHPNVTFFEDGLPRRASADSPEGQTNKVLRIAWPGGQNVRTLCGSRFHPLRRPQRPYGVFFVLAYSAYY